MNQISKIHKHSKLHTIKLKINTYNIINSSWIRLNQNFQTPTRDLTKPEKKKKKRSTQPNLYNIG